MTKEKRPLLLRGLLITTILVYSITPAFAIFQEDTPVTPPGNGLYEELPEDIYIEEDGHNCDKDGAKRDCREDAVETCDDLGMILCGITYSEPIPWTGIGAFFECGVRGGWEVTCEGRCCSAY
ncbi:MAG: hypothetical protein DCC75_12170 [Proteobacteria bacterium]|nr:MAG: hypothetical protein DCC75_12170 [Pseudomonadota bacterium]